MSIVTLKNIEWKELTTSKGGTATGHELVTVDADGAEKTSKVFDAALKKRPELKEDFEKLKGSELPKKVKMEFVKDGAYTALNRVTETTEDATKQEVKKTFVKRPFRDGTVSDTDRQRSIERQNALTNATTIVAAINTRGAVADSAELVKEIAKKLLKFHEEV